MKGSNIMRQYLVTFLTKKGGDRDHEMLIMAKNAKEAIANFKELWYTNHTMHAFHIEAVRCKDEPKVAESETTAGIVPEQPEASVPEQSEDVSVPETADTTSEQSEASVPDMTAEVTDNIDKMLDYASKTNNHAILDSYCKAVNVIHKSNNPACAISGGADSDLVLDIISRVDSLKKVRYYWVDTGLEYQATKNHLQYLEDKYGVQITHLKPNKSIPMCVREYGVPFLSKYVSEQMMRLQQHNFKWEDEPLEILLSKYPNCKIALQWWCNERYNDIDGIQKISQFAISRNKYLKEFIMANPPDFMISNKCCEYSKKMPIKKFIKTLDADLDITGIRKAEGGVRSIAYKTCFSEQKSKGCNTYRPIFWYTNNDKTKYEETYNIKHSACYTKYGLKRTGCVGCPYNRHIMQELDIIAKHEPKMYKACINIFGKSYEYTKKYRDFCEEMKRCEGENKRKIPETTKVSDDVLSDTRHIQSNPDISYKKYLIYYYVNNMGHTFCNYAVIYAHNTTDAKGKFYSDYKDYGQVAIVSIEDVTDTDKRGIPP